MEEAWSYYKAVLQKYVDFSGRARRAEYWYFALVNLLISIGLSILDSILGTGNFWGGVVSGIYGLAVLLPSIAVAVRRLHDTNRSGWWILIALIPFVGWLILLYWMVTDGDAGENQYGPNPKEAAPAV